MEDSPTSRRDTSDVLPQDFRSRPLVVLSLLWLVWLLHAIDRNIMAVLLEPIGREFVLSDSQLGLIAGLGYALPFVIAGIPMGALADRWNRKRLLLGLLTVWSTITMTVSMAGNFGTLLALRAAVGVSESGAAPAMTSILADSCQPAQRSAMLSVLYTGPSFGAMLGMIVGGAIAALAGWRTVFLVAGGAGLALAVVVAILLLEPQRGKFDTQRSDGEDVAQPVGRVLRSMMANREIAFLTIGFILATMLVPSVLTWSAVYLIRSQNMTIAQAGWSTGGGVGLFSALGILAGGFIVHRWFAPNSPHIAKFCGWALIAAIPAGLFAMQTSSSAVIVATLAIWALLTSMYTGPANSVLLGLVSPRSRGTAIAVLTVGTNVVGAGLGPQIIGLTSDWLRSAGDPQPLRHAITLMVLLGLLPAWMMLQSGRFGRHKAACQNKLPGR